MNEIRALVMNEPLFETHTHQQGCAAHDWEKKTFDEFIAYGTADLATAGVPFEAGNKDKIFTAWPYVRTTGYGQATEHGVRALFDLAYTSATADAVTAALRAFCRGKTSRQVHEELYARANIHWSVNDFFWEQPGKAAVFSKENFPDLFRFVTRFEQPHVHGLIGSSKENVAAFEQTFNVSIHSLAELGAALDRFTALAKATGRLAGVKIALAYGRALEFSTPSSAEAERIFALVMQGRDAERAVLEDYLLHQVIQRARTFDLPVQIHTGYLAGNWQDIRQGDPTPLVPVFRAYRDVRFDIFHASWPWANFIGAVAKELPNVWLDLCWAWAMSPIETERVLDEWLAAVPCNKIFAFGGDTTSPFQEVGYALQARQGIARVLERKLARGEYDEQTAAFVARRIMHENARDFFRW